MKRIIKFFCFLGICLLCFFLGAVAGFIILVGGSAVLAFFLLHELYYAIFPEMKPRQMTLRDFEDYDRASA